MIIDVLIDINEIVPIKEKIKIQECAQSLRNFSISLQKIAAVYLIVAMLVAIVSPIPHRDILVLIPLMLIFEKEILWLRHKMPKTIYR